MYADLSSAKRAVKFPSRFAKKPLSALSSSTREVSTCSKYRCNFTASCFRPDSFALCVYDFRFSCALLRETML